MQNANIFEEICVLCVIYSKNSRILIHAHLLFYTLQFLEVISPRIYQGTAIGSKMQFPNRDQDPQIEEPLLASRHSYVLRPPRVISACVLTEGLDSDAKVARYKKTQRKFVWALALAFFFMFVEVTGGIYAGSLAIITDAAHLLSDISGFAVSIAAAYYAAQKTSESHHFSYGFHRVEVLGALASILSVWLVTGILVFEAVQRIFNPEPVDGKSM